MASAAKIMLVKVQHGHAWAELPYTAGESSAGYLITETQCADWIVSVLKTTWWSLRKMLARN